jgi:hypothetical protein
LWKTAVPAFFLSNETPERRFPCYLCGKLPFRHFFYEIKLRNGVFHVIYVENCGSGIFLLNKAPERRFHVIFVENCRSGICL